MKSISTFILTTVLLSCLICQSSYSNNSPSVEPSKTNIQSVFDSQKWKVKQGKDYPHRNAMLDAIVYTDNFRKLSKSELLNELGEPSYYREDKNYLHYIITQTRLLSWPLHTKVLVIKLKEDESVEWIKIHE